MTICFFCPPCWLQAHGALPHPVAAAVAAGAVGLLWLLHGAHSHDHQLRAAGH